MPSAKNGERQSVTFSARDADRLSWCRHFLKLSLNVDAGNAVVLRAALAHYVEYLEDLMANGTRSLTTRTVNVLKQAARGGTESLDPQQLFAVPVRPLSSMASAAHEERMAREPCGLPPLPPVLAHPGGPEDDASDF